MKWYAASAFLIMWSNVMLGAELKPVFNPPKENSPTKKKAGRTPFDQLINAIESSNTKAVYDMLEQFPDLLDQTDEQGLNPLHLAAHAGNLPAAKIMGAKIEKRWWFEACPALAKATDGQQPIAIAISAGKHDLVKYLLTLSTNYDYLSLVARAIQHNRFESLIHLFERLDQVSRVRALECPAKMKTSPEILYFLGQNLNYQNALQSDKNLIKQHIQFMFSNHPLPVACELIRGYESQNHSSQIFPYDELLSPEQLKRVNDYIKYPEKYLQI